ncbi:hypothetical protein [Desulfonatronospira sp.]|uniref:hypothetical protein n=1 Tax=Desulfonatronospira sp. TaxID=1962951 RepID=UPI0025B86850|nr:hypothetical protein [Desulfonatronospira sp.]
MINNLSRVNIHSTLARLYTPISLASQLWGFGQDVDLFGKGLQVAQRAEIALLNMIDEFLYTSRQTGNVNIIFTYRVKREV